MENTLRINVKGSLPENTEETDLLLYILDVIKGTRAKEISIGFSFKFEQMIILKEFLSKENIDILHAIPHPDVDVDLNVENLYPLMMHLPSKNITAVKDIENMPVNIIVHDNEIDDLPDKSQLIRINFIGESIPVELYTIIDLPYHYNIISTLPVIIPNRSVYYMNKQVAINSIKEGKIIL